MKVNSLSVIVPVHNEAPFLQRCFDSLEKQGGGFDVIVVENGSTDASPEICDAYKDKFQVYHLPEANVGKARNFGLDKVQTEWATFLDADDEWQEGAILILRRAVQRYKDFNLLGFNHLRQYNSSRLWLKYTNPQRVFTNGKLPVLHEVVWTRVYRADFLRRNKIRFSEKTSYAEDSLFNLECYVKAKKIMWLDETYMIKHFDNPHSITHSITPQRLVEAQKEIKRYMDTFKELNAPEAILRKLQGNLAEFREKELSLRSGT